MKTLITTTKLVKSIVLLSFFAMLSSCGSGGGSSSSGESGISGLAQKGPFATGGTVTAYQLVNGVRGSSATTTISNDLGSYSFSDLAWSGATEIEVVGKYFNENNNTITAGVGTITSVIDVATDSTTKANVNVLTNLATAKAKQLLAGGDTDAISKAQAEVKSLFGLDSSVKIDELNLTTKGNNATAATELLRISAAIAASPTILATLTEEIKTGGGDNGVSGGATFGALKTELITIDANFATITANIGSLTGIVASDVPVISDKNTNTAPVNTFATSTITVNEDSAAFTRTLTATDVNSDTITFSAESSDTNKATISVSGTELTITPVANANGTLTITVASSDSKFKTYSTIPLDITAVNDTPTITTNQSFSIAENSSTPTTVGTVAANDVETNSLGTWTIASGNTNTAFAISSAGVITAIKSLDRETFASYNLGITVNDGDITSVETVVTVNVTNVNEAPTLTDPSDVSTTYGTNATTISLSGNDVDSTNLIYSASSSSDAIATTSVSGADVTITPKGFGTATISVSVSDSALSANQTLTFFVAKKDLTITATSTTKAYNEDNPTLESTNSGLVSGDTLTGGLSTTATKTSSVGTYPIASTLANANYNVTFVAGTLTITKADQAAIVVTDLQKDAVDADFLPTYTGGNGDGTLTATLSSNPSVAVATATGKIDVLTAGTTTISVRKGGDANYNDSATETFVLTVVAAAQQAQGVAVDGYLAGSDVCLDLNINDACDEDEPRSITGSDGSYKLTFSVADQNKPNFKTSPILITGGKDIGLDKDNPDNKPFVGSLKALNTLDEGAGVTEINLSPATKMLATGVMKKRAEAEAASNTFTTSELDAYVDENEPKVKKAMKIPTDKPLTADLSLPEFRGSYQQSLSIHKALETMVEAQVKSQKATTQTITAIDAMDDMYSLAFDTILDDNFNLDSGTLTANALLTHMQTDDNIKNNIPAGALKVMDRAKKIGDTVHEAFENADDNGTVSLTKINRIEDVIKLEFDSLKNDLDDFNWNDGAAFSTATQFAAIDTTTFFTQDDAAFEDLIAVETLQLDDKFKDFTDDVLKNIIDQVQVAETQTSVVDLFEDFSKFAEVIKKIDTSTFTGTATTAFDKIDDFIAEQQQEEIAERKAVEEEKAKNADGYSMSLPYTIYGVDSHTDNNQFSASYWEAVFNADNSLTLNDYSTSATATGVNWVSGRNDSDDFELAENGSWVKEPFNTATKTIEILEDKRVLLKLDGAPYEKLKLFESDANNQEVYDNELKAYITLPEGSKRVLMSIERMTDTYRLDHIQKDYSDYQNNPNGVAYTSFSDFITGQCGDRWFSGNENGGYAFKHIGTQTATQNNGWMQYSCDGSATSGTIVEVKNTWNGGSGFGSTIVNDNAGTWKIETIHGQDLLIVKPNNPFKYSYDGGLEYPILAVKDSQVWSGKFEPKGEGDSWYAYNSVAVEKVKEVALQMYQASQQENAIDNGDNNNGGDNTNDGNDNNGGDSGNNNSTTFTITGHTPISITSDQNVHNNGVDLATLAGGDATAKFKIVNWSEVRSKKLGITIEMNSDSGNYVTPNNNDSNNYEIHVHPNNNTGTVTVILQAQNSSGVESNTISFTVTVNDVSSNNDILPSDATYNSSGLTSPNGGESWNNGSTYDVTWDTSKIFGQTVDLYVLHDNTSFDQNSITSVNSKTWYKFATNVSNNGSHNIDANIMNGTGNMYKVLIVGVDNGTTYYDISENYFNLNYNNNTNNYTSFNQLVAGRCYDGVNNTSYFDQKESNNDIKLAFACSVNQDGVSGNLVSFDSSNQNQGTQTAGTWAIETVQGIAVLVVNATNPNDWDSDGNKTIFAIKDGFVWQGEIEKQGDGEIFTGYNNIAGEMVLEAIANATTKTTTQINTIESGASLVSSITTFVGTSQKIYWDFEYRNENNTHKKQYYSMIFKDDGTSIEKSYEYNSNNSTWIEKEASSEVRLESGNWVADNNANWSATGANRMTIGPYGEFEVYIKDINNTTTIILGESVSFGSGATRIYLKRVSANTPDVYYLHSKM